MSKLLNYYYSILAKKDYSRQELIDKAIQKEYTNQDIEQSILELENKKYINDNRLAENIVYAYQNRKGKIWLSQKMQQRKIGSKIIQNVLSEIENKPDTLLKQKIEQKYGVDDWNEIELKTKNKILNYLKAQGYSNVWDILRTWQQEELHN